MPVCNLLGNIYNKAYRSILSNIMMSNDGRICFIVVPDKNIMENITSVISWQPFWISCFTKYPQGWEPHTRPDITIGEPAKHNQNRKKTISQNNVSRSFTSISGCFCSYLHKYRLYDIFFLKTNERIGFLIPANTRMDISFMSLAYVVAKFFVIMFIFI